MGGELDFRDDLNVARGRIIEHFADVVLCIIASETFGIRTGPGADLGQARIFLYLQAPARIVDEMELQLVELIGSHHVYVFLDKLLVIEIAGHIKHHASPRTGGGVGDGNGGNTPVNAADRSFAIYFRRHQLKQRLYAVENASGVMAGDGDSLGCDRQDISFRLLYLFRIDGKEYVLLAFGAFRGPEVHSGGAPQAVTENVGLGLKPFAIDDSGRGRDFEGALLLDNALGNGNDGRLGCKCR